MDEIKKSLDQNHRAIFNQTWHSAALGEGNSSLFKWRAPPFSQWRWLRNSENTLTKLKNLLQNHWVYLNQTWHNAFSCEIFQIKDQPYFQGKLIKKYIDEI